MPDSAATATAFLCGVKVNYETIGVDPMVSFGDCEASKDPKNQLSSVLEWAQEAGKATGELNICNYNLKVWNLRPRESYYTAYN